MSYLVKLEEVTKNKKGKDLIRNVSFELNQGEILGFVGPNGSGKSTTMKSLTGLYQITSGEIYIANEPIKSNLSKQMALNLGVFIEEPKFYENLTARRNLKLHCRLYGVKFDEISILMERFGLKEAENIKVKNYSLGMKQRLGLIRAFIHKPQVLILDEPTNGLDPKVRGQLREFLFEYVSDGNAILISSHLLSELDKLCDRIVYINKGKIKNDADFKITKKQYKFSTNVNILNILDFPLRCRELHKDGKNLFESKIKAEINEIPKIIELLIKEKVEIYLIEEDSSYIEENYLQLIQQGE